MSIQRSFEVKCDVCGYVVERGLMSEGFSPEVYRGSELLGANKVAGYRVPRLFKVNKTKSNKSLGDEIDICLDCLADLLSKRGQ